MRKLTWVAAAVLAVCGSAWAQEAKSYEPIAKAGGIEVYAKMDFDKGPLLWGRLLVEIFL
jgi:hypothetical protein